MVTDGTGGHQRHLRGELGWFFALELASVAVFSVLLASGRNGPAAAVLAFPFQLLAWAALLGTERGLLLAFTALLPLAGSGLLPHAYERFVYFPATLALLAAAGISLTAPTAKRRGGVVASHWGQFLAFLLWVVVCTASAMQHGWGTRFLIISTLVTAEVMLLGYFYAAVPRRLLDVRLLAYVSVGAASVVAICLPLLPSTSGSANPLLGKMVITPFAEINLNTIGYMIGPIAALALGMAAGSDRVSTRLWLGAAVFICVLMLLFTKSRGAWLGFGAAFLYLIIRSRSAALVVLAGLSGLAVAGTDILRALLVSRAGATTAYDPALLGRFRLWEFAWRIGRENWLFGVGMDNFRYVKHLCRFPESMRASIQFNAHNLYLELFADIGAVGLVLFLVMLVGALVRSSRLAGVAGARDLGLGISAGLIAYAAHGLVDSIFFQPGVFALLALLFGLSMSSSRLAAGRQDARETAHRAASESYPRY